ncbi:MULTISPECIES: hypothetical protein [Edwardsiella]|uniref:Uncharacterized protein n=1 Tax=Edwardsiella anguillarum ET080813 TaxID=667120 RepID=A0A076LJY6_9GAMM|nr:MULTISPECIES: hypothetical protein [Edwardsiella]AIJ06903.1 Hypothetical protein ETEE_0425 [Edwardsiella anguillarum ET080813]MDA6077213.1 hypothetical protein [Edwardsiella anguillarum]
MADAVLPLGRLNGGQRHGVGDIVYSVEKADAAKGSTCTRGC